MSYLFRKTTYYKYVNILCDTIISISMIVSKVYHQNAELAATVIGVAKEAPVEVVSLILLHPALCRISLGKLSHPVFRCQGRVLQLRQIGEVRCDFFKVASQEEHPVFHSAGSSLLPSAATSCYIFLRGRRCTFWKRTHIESTD